MLWKAMTTGLHNFVFNFVSGCTQNIKRAEKHRAEFCIRLDVRDLLQDEGSGLGPGYILQPCKPNLASTIFQSLLLSASCERLTRITCLEDIRGGQ